MARKNQWRRHSKKKQERMHTCIDCNREYLPYALADKSCPNRCPRCLARSDWKSHVPRKK